jgi:hypothetical protein
MQSGKLGIQVAEVPERSSAPTELPAIGLTKVVRQEGAINPFDIGESLSRHQEHYKWERGRQSEKKQKELSDAA